MYIRSINSQFRDGDATAEVGETSGVDTKATNPEILSPNFLHSVLEGVHEGVLVLDAELRICWLNTESARLLGITRERATGLLLGDVAPEALKHDFVQYCQRALAERKAQAFEIRDEASKRWYALNAVVLSEGSLAVYSRDITPQNSAESEWPGQPQWKLHAEILNTTSDAVIACDEGQRVTYCNVAAERQYGVRREDVLGQPLRTVYETLWSEPEEQQQAETSLKEQGGWTGEAIHVRQDGKRMFVRVSIHKLSPELGGGLFAISCDITERKRRDLEHERSAAQLKRANEDLLHFAYAVSHDLQAPLRSSSSFTQLLSLGYKHLLDEQGCEFLERILEANSRMNAMIQDLLRFAKVAGGDLEVKSVQLEAALSSAMENLRADIQESGAEITHDQLPVVAADSGQSVQLLQNLIGNAIKYRKPDVPPAIHIASKQEGDEWVISVRDNGLGFEQKFADRIFGVFKRLHNQKVPGTGIGLTICKRIVERAGGRMWASGEPGEGAIFSFSLPVPGTRPARHSESQPDLEQPAETAQPVVRAARESEVYDRYFEESFRTLDLAPAFIRDLDGTVRVWTHGAERQFGWSKQEAQGKKTHDLFQTEFPQPLRDMEAELLRNGSWRGELKHRTKDGRIVWHMSLWTLHRDGSGRPQSVIEVNNDITALKEAEQALRTSSETRDLALQAGRMGVWQWERATDTVRWDEMVELLLDVEPGTLDGKSQSFLDRVHPEDRATLQRDIAGAVENGLGFQTEIRIRCGDNSFCWLRSQGRAVLDESRVPIALTGVIWDITGRKRAELELRESEQRYRALVDNASDPFFLHDLEGRMIDVNQQALSSLGYTREELLALTVIDIERDFDLEKARAAWDSIQPGTSLTVNGHHRRKDGTVFPVEARLSTLEMSDRRLVLAIVRDVSERQRQQEAQRKSEAEDRKRAEQALRERDDQLGQMFDSIDQLAWMAQGDGFIFWYNQRWYEYTGTTPEQMAGWGWQAVHDPEYLPRVMERWTASIQKGEPFDMEFPLRGADGVFRLFLTRGLPVRDPKGEVVRWFGTNTNIEALKQERDLLAESEQRFRELAEALPQLMWATDEQGKPQYYNPQFYDYTGMPEKTGPPETWDHLIHPDDAERIIEEWRKSLAASVRYNSEARLRRHDGVYRWFLNRAEPIRKQDGGTARWLGTSTDIHQQKITEEALRRTNADLEQFAYAASHDLREPLRMISIYTQKLLEKVPDGQQGDSGRFARYVVTGVSRMDRLLEAIQAYLRAGSIPAEGVESESEVVLERLLLSREAAIRENGALVTHDVLPKVACSEDHLALLFDCLIDNALKFRDARRAPRVHLTAELEQGWWTFSIRDNAIGIKAEYLERIFGIFKRLHREEYPGVGIGLAIAKRIVEIYGGRIWGRSELGEGSTFYFALPAVDVR